MFNPTFTENAAPAGFGILELIVDPTAPEGTSVIERPPRPHWTRRDPRDVVSAPLERTDLHGTVTGPIAALRLVQRFRVPAALHGSGPFEARYRFPLPGDAAVTGVVVRFGETIVRTTLDARDTARATYEEARAAGHQAMLLEREDAGVFTLSITGLRDDETIEVETRYVQRARLARGRWSLRVPLTTAPRFVRGDERDRPQADANPLATLRDPGHRFALDVTFQGADRAMTVSSPTHALDVGPLGGDGVRVRLAAGEVLPDRDCVLEWHAGDAATAGLHATVEDGRDGAFRYVLALVRPPASDAAPTVPRDLVLLVDRSGSMSGAKWDATRWAVRRLLDGFGADDRIQLGAFDDRTAWLDDTARAVDESTRTLVERFLDAHGPNGGTELGMALEAALVGRPRTAGISVARHCLVLTDGQVTDAGRILATVDREAARADARRVSVLCIDSAPNASLAVAIAEHGRGTAHFLSSDPSDGDVATALEDVLEGFDAPLAVGLTLTVDGTATRIDLGDLLVGRPAWVVLRLPRAQAAGATLRVDGVGTTALTASLDGGASGVAAPDGAVRATFGAERVRVLEQLAGSTGEALATGLRRLGYDPASVGLGASTVYAENALAQSQEAVRALLVRESLETGVPSTATAFVAVREVSGRPPERMLAVASALPAGWSGAFADDLAMPAAAFAPSMPLMSPMSSPPSPPSFSPTSIAKRVTRMFSALPSQSPTDMSVLREDMRTIEPPPAVPVWNDVPDVPADGRVVLYDSVDAPDGGIGLPSHISAAEVHVVGDAEAVPAGARLLLFVDDLAQPVARIDLRAALRSGGRRPLNVRRAFGARVRVVLEVPAGVAWPRAAGVLQVRLSS